MKFCHFFSQLLVALLFLSSNSSFAVGQCPTHFYQNKNHYLISMDPPGWRSADPLPVPTQIHPDQFGGALYSPLKNRIACAYRLGSIEENPRWVIMLSSVYHHFVPRDLAGENWTYNKTRRDYTCIDRIKLGLNRFRPSDCPFEISHPR